MKAPDLLDTFLAFLYTLPIFKYLSPILSASPADTISSLVVTHRVWMGRRPVLKVSA